LRENLLVSCPEDDIVTGIAGLLSVVEFERLQASDAMGETVEGVIMRLWLRAILIRVAGVGE
jgi:hypothetical protein